MSPVLPASDRTVISRAGVDYTTTISRMPTLLDTDLLLISRSGTNYQCPMSEVKKALPGVGEFQKVTCISTGGWATPQAIQANIDANGGYGRVINFDLTNGREIVLEFAKPVGAVIISTPIKDTSNGIRLTDARTGQYLGRHSYYQLNHYLDLPVFCDRIKVEMVDVGQGITLNGLYGCARLFQ